MSGPSVTFNGVGVQVGSKRGPVTLLDDIDLSVAAGSWLAIVGPNGAGKTTLLRCLAGLNSHTGTITIGAGANNKLSIRERAKLVGLVPQSPVVPPGVRVGDYILLGRTPHQGLRYSASEQDRAVVSDTITRLDLETFGEREVETLSGGERQRVVIARALVQEAPVLVLDEPTTGLDIGHQFDVLELISELRAERGLTVISTMHDLQLAGQFADHMAMIAKGRAVASGRPIDVLTAENLATHYAIDAQIMHDPDGRVNIAVRRKQQQ